MGEGDGKRDLPGFIYTNVDCERAREGSRIENIRYFWNYLEIMSDVKKSRWKHSESRRWLR